MTRYATDADLTLRVPATLAVALALRTIALEDAAAYIDVMQFGDRSVRAHVMLAAHFLQLIPGGGMPGGGPASGVVSSRSAGAISVSYAVPSIPAGWDPSLASTDYGRQFLAIVATLVSVPEVG